MTRRCLLAAMLCAAFTVPALADHHEHNKAPEGFTALFDGKTIDDGWWGWGTKHYKQYMDATPENYAAMRKASLADINKHWSVDNGELVNDGHGLYLTTKKFYGNFEFRVDYKTVAKADSGIYLRGCPQVQIWDYTDKGKFKLGADKGSGGLWNNNKGSKGKDPLVLADKPFGEWNSFRIIMVGDIVTIYLNDKLIVDHAQMHNYFDRKAGMPATGPIQLQTHGGEIRWRNIYIREIGEEEGKKYLANDKAAAAGDDDGFEVVFNGKDLTGWKGATQAKVADGTVTPNRGVLYTEKVYKDFVAKFEFKLPAGGNNGLALRYPGGGDPAYAGMCELQVLDNTHAKYAKLDPRQYHGSIYGQVAAKRGHLKPVGEWNTQTVTVKGHHIKVELNGVVITDADVSTVTDFMGGKADKYKNRMRTEGHFGFAGHGDPVQFRNIRIKELK